MTNPPTLTSPKHFLSASDLSREAINAIIDRAIEIKRLGLETQPLIGESAALIFEKPSLRTRVSFEAGLHRLGAHPIELNLSGSRIGERESIPDLAAYLSRAVSLIIARVHDHGSLEELARHASIPVINALSDLEHPCQALADLLTIKEHTEDLAGITIGYVGDGNNVCHSLMLAAPLVGASITIVTPSGREPSEAVTKQAIQLSHESTTSCTVTDDVAALEGVQVLYTDTWTSMGAQDTPADLKRFEPYKVNKRLMNLAAGASGQWPLFLHCMPAHRGVEVDADVIDGPTSIVYDQAENRMHAQNALVRHLIAPSEETWPRK